MVNKDEFQPLEEPSPRRDDPASARMVDEQELLKATLSWRLGGGRLEDTPGAQRFINGDPGKLEQVRLLERILTKYRAAGGQSKENRGR